MILVKRQRYYLGNKKGIRKKQAKYQKENISERKKTNKKYYEKNKERINEARRAGYRTPHGMSKVLFANAKKRAQKQEVLFDITKTWIARLISSSSVCPITNKAFVVKSGDPDSRTLDRIVPYKGYTEGNVLLISLLANRVKNNGTFADLQRLIKQLEKINKMTGSTWIQKCKFLKLMEQEITYTDSAKQRRNIKNSLLAEARRRASKKHISFSLVKSDLLIPNKCYLLNIPMKRGIRKIHDFSPSIDRIDNKRGYDPTNIQVISYKANRMKNSCTIKELQQVYSGFIKIQKRMDNEQI